MSPFQKILELYSFFSTDSAYYYLKGKKSYSDSDAYISTSVREFLLRQLKIYLEESFIRDKHLKRSLKDNITEEFSKITSLMEISAMAQSFEKDEWKDITAVMLKLVEMRIMN